MEPRLKYRQQLQLAGLWRSGAGRRSLARLRVGQHKALPRKTHYGPIVGAWVAFIMCGSDVLIPALVVLQMCLNLPA